MGVLCSALPSRAVTSHESRARRIVRPACHVQPQEAAVPLHSCFAGPVVQRETRIVVPLPLIELPDPEGFYASLVLRKVRAEIKPGGDLREWNGFSPKWNAVDRPSVAQTSREVARCGTPGEPLETHLAEIALRYVQTPVLGGRSS